ncbi:MAG TPA: zf-HC2 domain-containing protein [Pyrinomonadaceae bacterium]|jgi:anti-sigma factor RsiW|nr:zf-HC2 domain-containing protein [Pyrinomonadaceae bacterium]
MSTQTPNKSICGSEEIVAYLDGELEPEVRARLEAHLAECAPCVAELEMQQRLLRELDFALSDDEGVLMPKNFAQIVAARAQSDLSGVRERHERRRAFRLCVLLGSVAVALTGGAAVSESVFAPLRAIWRVGAALLNFLGHALYDMGASVAVISRGVGGHLLFESRPLGLLVLFLFVSALYMLRRLIAGYHRTRIVE